MTYRNIILLSFFLLLAFFSNPQVINLFAGGYVGDGLIATSAGLTSPSAVCVDTAGNIYIADIYNNRIRKVDAITKLISTVAGTGETLFSGDGGPAINASINTPAGIALDKKGNIYFSDQGNFRVRRIDALTGIITTIAGNGYQGDGDSGGNAVNTNFNYPSGISVDTSGNIIYLCDQGNNKVKKINLATGIITNLAGSFTGIFSGDGGQANNAFLNSPNDVCVDKDNNVYICDGGNSRIRKVNAITNIITTVAGGGGYGSSFENVVATSSTLSAPNAVFVDNQYNIFIGEALLCTIRKVNGSTRIINTIAGSGRGFSGDGGPAISAKFSQEMGLFVDSGRNIFIADGNNNRIRKINAADNVINTVAGGVSDINEGSTAKAIGLNYPEAVCFDKSGNAYIGEKNSARILKVEANTGIVSIFAGNGTAATTGDGGLATAAALQDPRSITIDTSGNLYFINGNSTIRKINNGSGIITTVAGNGTFGSSGDNGPATNASISAVSVCVSKKGDLIFTEGYEKVRTVNAVTGIITKIAGTGTYGGSGQDGPALEASFRGISGICLDSAENIYISESGSHIVRRIDVLTGIISTVAGIIRYSGFSGDGGPATDAQLRLPSQIAVDKAGNLFIMDGLNNRVRKVDAGTKIISTYAGTGIDGFSGDGGPAAEAQLHGFQIAADKKGSIYVCDFQHNVVRQISPAATIHKYTFTGNGDWDDATNWENQMLPPEELEENTEIIINPVANGECLLSRIRHTKASTKVIVAEGKSFRINGGLFIQ